MPLCGAEAVVAALIFVLLTLIAIIALAAVGTAPRAGGPADPRAGDGPTFTATTASKKGD